MPYARAIAAIAIVLAAPACSRDNPVQLAVIAPPDGGDPFLGADAATQARITYEADVPVVRTVAVSSNGSFQIPLPPSDPQRPVRVRVEALRGDRVIGAGATPFVRWGQQGGQLVAVFVQYCDTLAEGPVTLATGRADFEPIALGLQAIIAVTSPPGETTARAPDAYDLLHHARTSPFVQTVPALFDGETTIIRLRDTWLLQRRDVTLNYTGNQPTPSPEIPAGRAALTAGTVVSDGTTYSMIFGGADSAGQPSDRVDVLSFASGAFGVDMARTLATPRRRPAVFLLQAATDALASRWLVAGGQADGAPLFEAYGPQGSTGALSLGDPELEVRSRATVVVYSSETDHPLVLLLGGVNRDGSLAMDDALIDGDCLLRTPGSCTAVLSRGPWLSHRRHSARGALADGGRVVIAGGRDAAGPVMDVESVLVDPPGRPAPGRVLATLAVTDPSLIGVSTGNVVVLGGRGMDGAAGQGVWFYRGCSAARP